MSEPELDQGLQHHFSQDLHSPVKVILDIAEITIIVLLDREVQVVPVTDHYKVTE